MAEGIRHRVSMGVGRLVNPASHPSESPRRAWVGRGLVLMLLTLVVLSSGLLGARLASADEFVIDQPANGTVEVEPGDTFTVTARATETYGDPNVCTQGGDNRVDLAVTGPVTVQPGAGYSTPTTTSATYSFNCANASVVRDILFQVDPSAAVGDQATLTFSFFLFDELQSIQTVTVSVVDITAPVLTVPDNITVEATSSAGAVVTYTATATDAVDGSVTPVCTPASGSTFPIGTTTVSCTATDAAGNISAAKTFTITVRDTTGPVITWVGGPQPNQTYTQANLPAEPTCTATDTSSPVVQCRVYGYSTAPGTHTLTARARDAEGNASVSTRTYTVTASAPTATPRPATATPRPATATPTRPATATPVPAQPTATPTRAPRPTSTPVTPSVPTAAPTRAPRG